MGEWSKEVINSELQQFTKNALIANVIGLENELKTTEEKLKVAVDALEFYGDYNNWHKSQSKSYFKNKMPANGTNPDMEFIKPLINGKSSCGKIARQALKKIKEQKDK